MTRDSNHPQVVRRRQFVPWSMCSAAAKVGHHRLKVRELRLEIVAIAGTNLIAAGARIVVVSLTTPNASTRGEIRRLADLPPGMELWIGGPAAASMQSLAGGLARLVPELADLVPMLSRHAH